MRVFSRGMALYKSNSIKPLYEYENNKICQKDFINALRKVGIKKGDVVFIHSDISVFGKLCTLDKNFLLSSLVDAFKEVLSPNGTIIMPTFSYSFCNREVYDVNNTKSTVGVLTEFFRKQSDVVRTAHPIFSVAIWGEHKYDLLDVGKDSFDENSIFDKIHKFDGKIVFLGIPFESTYVHYVEQMHGIPYRYIKKFKGTIINNDKKYEEEVTYFVRYLDKNVVLDLSKFEKYLLEKNLLKKVKLGNSHILMVESDVFFNEGCKLLDKDIYFFLKERPNI